MKIVYTLFFLVGAFKLDAQYFNYLHTYDTTAEYNRNILLRPDNSLLVTGGYLGLNDFHEDACWFNFSAWGDTILSKHSIHTEDHAYYIDYSGNAKLLSNGGYIVPYSLHYYPNNPDRWYNTATLVLLDAQLDTVWVKRYTDTSLYAELVYDCDVLPDGSYLVAGLSNTTFTAQQTQATIKGMLMRIDAQGNLVWKHFYQKETGKECNMRSVQPLDNNRSLIGGNSVDVVPVGSSYYFRRKPWFVIVDNANGNILKDTLYTSGYFFQGGVYKDMNGGYYHTGMKDSLASQNVNDNANFPIYLSHLDTNFHTDWITTLPYSYQPYFKYSWRLRQLQNGDFMICGAAINTSNYAEGWVARISNAGAILWSKYYYSQSNKEAYLSDFVERPDGNIILCGWTSNDTVANWHGQEVWLLGLYASGVVLTGSAAVGNTPVKTMEFSIYPNPAKDIFYLEVPEQGTAELYDMGGRRVAMYEVKKGKSPLRLPDAVASGNYLLQFTGEESGMIAGKGLVKQ